MCLHPLSCFAASQPEEQMEDWLPEFWQERGVFGSCQPPPHWRPCHPCPLAALHPCPAPPFIHAPILPPETRHSVPHGKRGPQEAQRQTGVESEGRGAAQVAPANHSELDPDISSSMEPISACPCMTAGIKMSKLLLAMRSCRLPPPLHQLTPAPAPPCSSRKHTPQGATRSCLLSSSVLPFQLTAAECISASERPEGLGA